MHSVPAHRVRYANPAAGSAAITRNTTQRGHLPVLLRFGLLLHVATFAIAAT